MSDMDKMPEETLKEIFTKEFNSSEDFAEWFVQRFKDSAGDTTTKKTNCTIEEFAVHFLALIRSQTEDFTKCPPSLCDTPKRVPPGPSTSASTPAPTTIRKLSITSSAADPQAATVNSPLSLSAASAKEQQQQQHQLTTATSGLKGDTAGTCDENDGGAAVDSVGPVGNRSQSQPGSITRDLFVGAPVSVDAFRESEDGGGFHGDFRKIGVDVGIGGGLSGENAEGKDESQKPISIEDAPFSPIPTVRHHPSGQPTALAAASRIDFGSPVAGNSPAAAAFVSTPIRGGGPNSKLNTSTPIAGHNRSKGGNSRNSSWATLDCSTPPGNGNGSRNDSRRSHDRSGGGVGGNRQTSSPCLGDFITHSSLKSKSRKSLGGGNNSKDGVNKTANSIFLENDFPGLGASMQSSTPGTGGDQQQRNKKRVTPITVSKTLTSRLGGSSFEMDNLVSSPAEGKSRRRVTPTILSRSTSSRHDFNSSSFKSDNNLINLTEDNSLELDLSQKDERGLLRNYKDIIKSNFEAAEEQNPDPTKMIHAALRNTTINTPRKISESTATPPLIIDLKKVTKQTEINRLVDIYTLIIDLNLTPNILSEFSYLINLINTEFDPFETTTSETPDPHNILKNLNNCIYFAMEVLNRQRNLLALLDSITLKVLVENERIASLNVPLHGYLREIHSQKLALDSSGQRMLEDASIKLGGNWAGVNVLYQQEADTKEHFPTEREFGAFKKQRDAFCTIYRTWDFKHLNPTWNFLAELGGKVRALLAIMEHPINMAHLAKLFTAQLVQSCNFHNSASELAMALPNVDPAKLVKLRQRLVAPSQFSTQYLFPGSQAFFRDFIVASESNQIFIEQLKAALIHELVGMNDSSYEVLNVSSSGSQHESEYVVRPESTTTMRVLAKFIGYIISRPFNYDSYRNSTVDNRQIELRNELQPLFDVKTILMRAIAERKLIITVPWLVQYLAMLDGISLRLTYYRGLFDVLYELYLRTSTIEISHFSSSDRKLLVTPTSKFIIRVSLGWLFEHPNVPEEYYSYRQERRSGVFVDQGLSNYKKIEEMRSKEGLNESPQEALKSGDSPLPEETKTSLIKYDTTIVEEETVPLNPLLESILNAACPFLADFRVSMMPSKLEKTVSRSGRYRHITTKYSGATTVPSAKQKPTNDQHKLLEAFLQSQSLSVRRTVEFVIERTSSAAVKDFQIAELLPKRKKISEQIASLEADTLSAATKRIYVICTEALAEINASWDAQLPPSLARRIKEGFDALLPNETLEAVKRTCINLALERCLAKTNEWRQTHMLEIDLFCKDIQGEAAKAVRPSPDGDPLSSSASSSSLVKPPSNGTTPSSTAPLTVILGRVQHTTVYERLQALIHVAASYPDELGPEELVQFLALVGGYLDEQDGTPAMNKTLAYMLLQLALLLVINRCDLIVPDIVQALLAVWKHRKLVEFCQIPETGGDGGSGGTTSVEEEIERLIMASGHGEDGERSLVDEADIQRIRDRKQQEEANYIFSTLVSNRYIRMMEFSQQQQQHQNQNQQQQNRMTTTATVDEVFACFANFICSLVDSNLITIRRLNEQFVRIFNEDWQQHTLERVSRLMDAVLRSGRDSSSSSSSCRQDSRGHHHRSGASGGGPGGHQVGTADDSHSQLFLEMLSDLAREIEDF